MPKNDEHTLGEDVQNRKNNSVTIQCCHAHITAWIRYSKKLCMNSKLGGDVIVRSQTTQLRTLCPNTQLRPHNPKETMWTCSSNKMIFIRHKHEIQLIIMDCPQRQCSIYSYVPLDFQKLNNRIIVGLDILVPKNMAYIVRFSWKTTGF